MIKDPQRAEQPTAGPGSGAGGGVNKNRRGAEERRWGV